MKQFRYKDLAEEVINSLKDKNGKWIKSWEPLINDRGNAVSRTGHQYNGINAALLPNGEYVTFLQIQQEGGSLNKGAKGHKIFTPIVKKEIDPLTKEENTKFYGMFQKYVVFNVKDTTLQPKYYKPYEPIKNNINEEANQFDKYIAVFIESENIKFDDTGSSTAFYSPSKDAIVIPSKNQYKNLNEYYATALHEISHSTGHKSRLDRHGKEYVHNAYAFEELCAEFSTIFLMNKLGIETPKTRNNSEEYIKNWANQISKNMTSFIKTINDSTKSSNYVLEKMNYEFDKSNQINNDLDCIFNSHPLGIKNDNSLSKGK